MENQVSRTINGWEEITIDNEAYLYEVVDRLVVRHDYGFGRTQVDMVKRFEETIEAMSIIGGYYYYLLPEFKNQ